MLYSPAELHERLEDNAAITIFSMHNSAWVLCFLYDFFKKENRQYAEQSEIAEALDRFQAHHEGRLGLNEGLPKSGVAILADWIGNRKRILHSYRRDGIKDPCYELSADTEMALRFVVELFAGGSAGLEISLSIARTLLNDITAGTAFDSPEKKAQALSNIDAQIAELEAKREKIEKGENIFSEVNIRERYRQMEYILLTYMPSRFRRVEQDFREEYRKITEEIARSEGSRTGMYDRVAISQDAIRKSEQGQSFEDFLKHLRRDDASSIQKDIDMILETPVIRDLDPDERLHDVVRILRDSCKNTMDYMSRIDRQLAWFLKSSTGRQDNRLIHKLFSEASHALMDLKGLEKASPPEELLAFSEGKPDIAMGVEHSLKEIRQPVRLKEIQRNDLQPHDITEFVECREMAARLQRKQVDYRGNIRQVIRDYTCSSPSIKSLLDILKPDGLEDIIGYLAAMLSGYGNDLVRDSAANYEFLSFRQEDGEYVAKIPVIYLNIREGLGDRA